MLNNVFSPPPFQSPLIHAIFNCDAEKVAQLLETCDEDEELSGLQDREKRLPIHAAAYMGDVDVLNTVIKASLESKNSRVNAKDSKWLTPLHRACRMGVEVSDEFGLNNLDHNNWALNCYSRERSICS